MEAKKTARVPQPAVFPSTSMLDDLMSSNGPSIVTVCASRKYRHYSGNRCYSAHRHFWLTPYVPSQFIGAKAGNRYYKYLTSTIDGPLTTVVAGDHNR